MLTASISTFIKGENLGGMIVLSVITLLCIHIWFSTWYEITADGYLIVNSTLLIREKIAITNITTITRTSNPISSPALSLKRLEIRTGKKLWNVISPQKQPEFIRLLQQINPQIELKGFTSTPH